MAVNSEKIIGLGIFNLVVFVYNGIKTLFWEISLLVTGTWISGFCRIQVLAGIKNV